MIFPIISKYSACRTPCLQVCHTQALHTFDAPMLFEDSFVMSWLDMADQDLRYLIMGLPQVSSPLRARK